MQKRIYLACPYSHPEKNVMRERYKLTSRMTAMLLKQGHLVFSPVTHSHPLVKYGLPEDIDFWRNWCLSFLDNWATDLYVCAIDGWGNSKGVRMEINRAMLLHIPINILTGGFSDNLPADCMVYDINQIMQD